MSNPLVSVCIITYNHKRYISHAIESVLAQKVNFDLEIVIADDFSTDGTREIIQDYKSRFPNLISLLLQPFNVGPNQNWIDLISFPKSKYIAYFEGDDYWIDEYKLQKQIDFLDDNYDFNLCVHDCFKLVEVNNSFERMNKLNENTIFCLKDLLDRRIFIPTCSIVFRNFKIPNWLEKCQIGDWPLLIILLSESKGYYINCCMGVYRKHSSGLSFSLNKSNVNLILLNTFFEISYHIKNYLILEEISRLSINAFEFELNRGKFNLKLLYFSFKYNYKNSFKYIKKISKLILIKIFR